MRILGGNKSMATSVKKKTYGFTLTEIAIILGIVGMVLGVIWISAATLYTNMRIASSNRQLILITQAVRSIYATSVTIAAADGVAITGSLIPAGIFPRGYVGKRVDQHGSQLRLVGWLYQRIRRHHAG